MAVPPPTRSTASDPADLTPEGRRERHRRETFERLVRAARSIMFNRGLNDVTVQDITEAADVGKGTFFNYFQSKEHVFTRVAEYNRRGLLRTVERVRSGERAIDDGVAELVTWLMCPQGGDWLTYETNTVRALALNPDVRASFSEQVQASLPVYEDLFSIGQQRGVTRTDISAAGLASMTHMFLAGAQILHWIHNTAPTPASTSELVKKYFKLLSPPPAPAATTGGRPVRSAQTRPAPTRKAQTRTAAARASASRPGAARSTRTATTASKTRKSAPRRRR